MPKLLVEIPEDVTDALRLPPAEQERELRKELALALYQRGVLPLAERPLVGIGNEGDFFRLEHFVGGWIVPLRGDILVRDHQPVRDQAFKQSGGVRLVKMRLVKRGHTAENVVALLENNTARVAE